MATGMHQYDPIPNVLVPSTEAAIMQAIAMWGGGEIITNTGAKRVAEAFQMLKSQALTLGLRTIQYYYYTSSVQPNSQFVIAGPPGMDVRLEKQPPHVRMELILDSGGDIIQTGASFITSDPFPEASTGVVTSVAGLTLDLPSQYTGSDWAAPSSLPALDLRYWYVLFPRPNMASLVHADDNTLNVKLAWGDCDQTFSLVFDATDLMDHQLAAYQRQNFQGLTWKFGLSIDNGVIPFDQNYGLTMTVVNAQGENIVRLWNYAQNGSTNTDATFVVDFDNLQGGWTPSGPLIDPSTITQVFLTLTNPQYGQAVKLANYSYSTLSFRQLGFTGPGLTVNVPQVAPHAAQMTIGYDDQYHMTPKRLVDQIVALGYTKFCTLYIGMSHFMTLGWLASDARFGFTPNATPINEASLAWFADFYARLKAAGIQLIWSMSYEMLYEYAPDNWGQCDYQGNPALTGWTPPSVLLAFTRDDVMQHLQNTAAQCLSIQDASDTKYFQIGEPWWWDGSYGNQQPCFYDAATQALFAQQHPGRSMWVFQHTADSVNTPEEQLTAYWLQTQLGISTLNIASHLKALFTKVKTGVLFFTPQAFGNQLTSIVNYPKTYWTAFHLDFFQFECYDEVTANEIGLQDTQVRQAISQLGYPMDAYQYFAGFVLNANQAAAQWPLIYQGMANAGQIGITNIGVWSFSQIVRDGVLVYQAV